MNYFLKTTLILLAACITFSAQAEVNPPSVTLTSLNNGQVFTGTTMVLLSAMASDADGEVISVEFFVNGVSVGIDAAFPYRLGTVLQPGRHTITVQAKDNDGNLAFDTVEVVVYNKLINATLSTPLRS